MDFDSAAVIVSAAVAALAVAFAAGMYHANKRPINVHQEQHNHAAPVTVTTSGDTLTPKLIGGLVMLVAVGLASAVVIQAVTTFTTAVGNELSRIGRDIDRTFNPPVSPTAVPAQQPTPVAVPQTAPLQVERPLVTVPEHQFQLADLLVPVLIVLAAVASGLWLTIGVMLIGRRRAVTRPRRNLSAREVYGVAPVMDRAQTRIER